MQANYLEIQAFTQFVHTVTNDAGMRCYFDLDPKQTPYNNGKEMHMHKLAGIISRDDLMRLRAYIVHECGHKMHTDFNILREKPELSTPLEEQNQVKTIWAQLEDHRVDYLTIAKSGYLGDKHTLAHLEELIAAQYTPELLANIDKLDIESTTNAAVYALDVGHRDSFLPGAGIPGKQIEEALLSSGKRTKLVQKILKRKHELDEVRAIEDPRLGSEATYQLAKKIAKDMEDEKKEEEEQKENSSDGEGEQGDEEQEVTVSPTEFKSQHAPMGQNVPDKNLPPPTSDDDRCPPLSGMEEYHIINYPKRKQYKGSECGSYSNDPFRSGDNGYKNSVDKILSNCHTAQLANEVRRILQVRSRSTTAFNQKRGKLVGRDVHRVIIKEAKGYNERVFRTKRDAISLDVAVSILTDFSGSMSGRRMANAIAATSMLTDVLKALHINHEVAGFSTAHPGVVHMLFKEFNQPNRHIMEDMLLGTSQMCCNSDGDNVVFASSRLKHQKEKRKVLIVLSDGSPSSSFKPGNDTLLLKKVVEEVPKQGIEIIGLGIETDYGKRIYPVWETLNSANDLEVGLLNILRRNIFNV